MMALPRIKVYREHLRWDAFWDRFWQLYERLLRK